MKRFCVCVMIPPVLEYVSVVRLFRNNKEKILMTVPTVDVCCASYFLKQVLKDTKYRKFKNASCVKLLARHRHQWPSGSRSRGSCNLSQLPRGERRDKPPTGCRSTAALTQKDKTVSHVASLQTPNWPKLHVCGPRERPQERTHPARRERVSCTQRALMEAQCVHRFTAYMLMMSTWRFQCSTIKLFPYKWEEKAVTENINKYKYSTSKLLNMSSKEYILTSPVFDE